MREPVKEMLLFVSHEGSFQLTKSKIKSLFQAVAFSLSRVISQIYPTASTYPYNCRPDDPPGALKVAGRCRSVDCISR